MSFRCIILVLLAHHCAAQSPYFRQITDEEGLPGTVVYDIYQSRNGYIWLGTEVGICRYDGITFKTYPVKNSQGKSLTNLQEDSQGNIYGLNFIGQLFKVQNGEIKQVELPSNILKESIWSYLVDQQDNLWICSNSVYFKANQGKWKVVNTFIKRGSPKIQQDDQGNVWIQCGWNYIYQLNTKLEVLKTIESPEKVVNFWVRGNSLKITNPERNKCYSYNFVTQKWQRIWEEAINKIPEKIRGFREDKQGNLWIFTNTKTFYYQPTSNKIQTLIKDAFISDLEQDREGNYWLASLGQGLFVFSDIGVRHFNRDNSQLDQVNCLAEDHLGNLYIGTNGTRLFYLDTQKEKLGISYHIPRGAVECLFFDKKRQKLYVENDLVNLIDVNLGKTIKELSMGNTPKDFALFQDKYLVAAAGNGGYIYTLKPEYNPTKWGFRKYVDSRTFVSRSKRGRAVCSEDKHQRFWIAYADGLYYYENGKATELKTGNNESIIAISLQVDIEGIVWAGTIQKGVFAIQNRQIIQHLDKSKGLISNFCRVVRDKGFLYLGTDQGLQVYHIKTKQSRVFNRQDGLPNNIIRDLFVQEDKIYLATNKGLSILSKDFSTTNHTPPLIHFTGLDIWDKAQQLKQNYQLNYDENNLVIHFTGLAFRSAGKFRYKYRMTGLDKQWTEVSSSQNFARYSALPAGQYQFEAKAINEDGIESKQSIQLRIDIASPIWARWWFITLMVLSGLSIIVVIFINRIRAIRRKSRLEKALGKATLESLKLQMNPHFLFNAMSSIQSYLIRNDASQASSYLSRFSKLMRVILETSRSEYITLEEEIEMLENYLTLQRLQYQGSFQYKISIDQELDPTEIAIPPMFAQPFIENAIEHGIADLGNEGWISISFELANDFVVLKITDNGIGLEKSQEKQTDHQENHESLATKITKERIDLYQKSLKKNIIFEILSSEQGTQVIFQLPYQNL